MKVKDGMRGILLDRDGVINRERADYVKSWDEFVFLPGALRALQRLAALPMPIVVLTNQSVIGRGIASRQTIDDIHGKAQRQIARAGGRIDHVFLCPHHPAEQCECRKPQPGLLQQAAAMFNLTLSESLFVGDAVTDYQAARAVGCQSILVRSGRQGKTLASYFAQQQREPAPPIVADLSAAADLILGDMTDSTA